MSTSLIALPDLRIPNQPDQALYLDDKPLSILNTSTFSQDPDLPDLTPAIGLATILYNWHPSALFALLDLPSWFSFTWTLTINQHTESEYNKIEIGRIRNQITFGSLDKEGLWKIMITFNNLPSDKSPGGGTWIPNTEESMLLDKNVSNPSEVPFLATNFVKDLIITHQSWKLIPGNNKKTRHEFFVESPYIGMDPWEDGLKMNPHWLYESLDLSRCTTCKRQGEGGLSRCGRCGTAAYCSSECQQKDWPVHKAVCSMSMEDRGKAIHYSSREGGLVNWREESEEVEEG